MRHLLRVVLVLISPSFLLGAPGPGLKDHTLPLPANVVRRFDLSHVRPAHVAAALEKDPQRIFHFVRDSIAYESYPGCLRGPRGTLLAMAGNSVDRATLLVALLEESGQKVRFAHGQLDEPAAGELVASMWVSGSPPAAKAGAKPDAGKWLDAIRRDYGLLRDQLKQAAATVHQPPDTPAALTKETQDHYWVQWSKDGGWVDLDPSFADAEPGHAYTAASETFDKLPDSLHHRVTLRVVLEEYAGDQPSTRPVLEYSATAAAISGDDLVLAHVAENWERPAKSIQSAVASAIKRR